MNVLNARRSPLSFRVQPLVLRLNTFDDDGNGWSGGQESDVFLVAKREVLVALDPSPSMKETPSERRDAETDTRTGGPVKPPAASAEAGSKSGAKSSHGADAVRVVEEEELGRIGPFAIHSPTTVLSGSSFKVPSNVLAADLQRRGGSGTGRNGAGSGGEAVAHIVLEIIRVPGGNKRPFLKKLKTHARNSASEEAPGGGGGTVVARATLDPGFLRRTIGCRRSVVMMTPPTGEARRASVSDQNAESAGHTAPPSFARLDVAGHAVSARPGRPKLRVQVLECQNLRSADVLGKSDPCVLVFWDGEEVGRTPIAREELHPVFAASGATFRLPLVPPPTTRTEGGDRRPGLKSAADWRAYIPELRLEVWDMDRDVFSRKWKKGQLLGSLTLRGPCGIAPVIEASTGQGAKGSTTSPAKRLVPEGVMLRLNAAGRRVSGLGSAAGKPEQASAGVVSIRIAVENDTDDSEAWVSQANATVTAARGSVSSGKIVPALDSSLAARAPGADLHTKAGRQGGLGVWCLDARGIPAGCDAYCRVFWNGMQVGSTPPASRVAKGLCGKASPRKHNAAPASAFQRNPVWWMALTQAGSCDWHGEERPDPKSSGATAVVPLHDNPSEENELTLEVFDGSHMQETNQGIAPAGNPIAGNGAVGKGSENSNTIPRRDVLGPSLGIVAIRGERLARPPGDRIDLRLQPPTPSSSKDSHAAGITLSITLARVRLDELSAGSTAPSTHPQQSITPAEQEQHQRNDIVSTVSPTSKTTAAADCHGGTAGALGEEQGQQRPARWLRLLIEGARLFKGLDISGTSDPFCVVYLDRVWHSETRVCWGTLSPRWDQWVQMEVFGRTGAPALGLGLAGHEVRVEVWDKDLVGANDFIGEVHLLVHQNRDG